MTTEQLAALAWCVDQAYYWRGSLSLDERDEHDALVATARTALDQLRTATPTAKEPAA